VDWTHSRFVDFDNARDLLAGCSWLVPPGADVEESLRLHFKAICDDLWPHLELVDDLADRLMRARTLSPRTVAAICREYRRRYKAAT